jgi:uncharacterized membrane protein YedE/YeeE
MAKPLIAFFCGLLFAVGLGVSQMTLPMRVIGFLDFFGRWDPTLMFVMGGAIAVFLPVWLFMRGRKPAFATAPIPRKISHDVDVRLFAGASVFGIGWGLAGMCPGPAIVVLGRPQIDFVVFVAAMLGGMAVFALVGRRKAAPA